MLKRCWKQCSDLFGDSTFLEAQCGLYMLFDLLVYWQSGLFLNVRLNEALEFCFHVAELRNCPKITLQLSEFKVLFDCDVEVQITPQWEDLSLLHCVLRDLFSVEYSHCLSNSKYARLKSRFIQISHKHRSSLPGSHKNSGLFLR